MWSGAHTQLNEVELKKILACHVADHIIQVNFYTRSVIYTYIGTFIYNFNEYTKSWGFFFFFGYIEIKICNPLVTKVGVSFFLFFLICSE